MSHQIPGQAPVHVHHIWHQCVCSHTTLPGHAITHVTGDIANSIGSSDSNAQFSDVNTVTPKSTTIKTIADDVRKTLENRLNGGTRYLKYQALQWIQRKALGETQYRIKIYTRNTNGEEDWPQIEVHNKDGRSILLVNKSGMDKDADI